MAVPFHFYECVALLRLTGKRAADIIEFLEIIKGISTESIFHHMHQYFLKPLIQTPTYPSDFAVWAAEGLEEKGLAERLANLNPYAFINIEDVRKEIIRIIETHLKEYPPPRPVLPGNEFFFNESVTLVIPTELKAENLEEFLSALSLVDRSSIYFHFYEARLRLGREWGDFTCWLEEGLGRRDLADKIKTLDPYMYPTEVLREKIINIVKQGI